MPNDKVLSNKKIGWFVGPDTTPSNYVAPSLASLQGLVNQSEGIRIGGTDFGIQATEMTDDRSFADEAGAQELGYVSFGGNVSTFVAANADQTSIHRQAHNTFKKPRTRLAILQRFGALDQATPLAAGQEVNLFRIITDAENAERRQTGYSITTECVGQDDCLINYIIPPAVPGAVTVGGTSGGAAGGYGLLTATYQGIDVTVQCTWTTADGTKVDVTNGAVARFIAAGTVVVTASYPGATAGTKSLTIT